jgi:hypothetical protein
VVENPATQAVAKRKTTGGAKRSGEDELQMRQFLTWKLVLSRRRKAMTETAKHDPEKHALGPRPDGWVPVFRQDHAQTKR